MRKVLVPGGGVEPPRPEGRRILSPLRLPVPPSRHLLLLATSREDDSPSPTLGVLASRRQSVQCQYRIGIALSPIGDGKRISAQVYRVICEVELTRRLPEESAQLKSGIPSLHPSFFDWSSAGVAG